MSESSGACCDRCGRVAPLPDNPEHQLWDVIVDEAGEYVGLVCPDCALQEDDEPDEFTPRERGLLIGHRWAMIAAPLVDRAALLAVAEGEIPDELRAFVGEHGMAERLQASDDPAAENAFWAGVVTGVRAFVVELDTGAAPK